MPVPAVVIGVGSFLLRAIAGRGAISALATAFRAGSMKGIGKALVKIVSSLAVRYFTVNTITRHFFSAAEYLFRFNWNVSDQAIDQQMKAALNSSASIIGGALGTTIGAIGCGGLMLYANPAALKFKEEISEEMIDEVSAAWAAALRASINAISVAGFLQGYKSLRAWLKSSGIAERILGQYVAEQWGKSSHIISFAQYYEDWLDTLGDGILRNFVEEFVEEAYESCKEFSLMISNYADMANGANRRNIRQDILGQEILVRVQPNRNVDETFVLAGRQEIVKAQTVQVLSQNKLLGNRDIGIVIGGGVPLEEHLKRVSREITCVFEYSVNRDRPFSRPKDVTEGGTTTKTRISPKYSIGNIARNKLDWEILKAAAGGANGYTYGRHRWTYYLTNNFNQNCGKIIVYGSTENEARQRSDAFLSLTTSRIKYSSSGEDKEGGNRLRSSGTLKPITQIYPTYVTIYAGVDTTSQPGTGRRNLNSPTARTTLRKARFPLWTNNKPGNFDSDIRELFSLLVAAD